MQPSNRRENARGTAQGTDCGRNTAEMAWMDQTEVTGRGAVETGVRTPAWLPDASAEPDDRIGKDAATVLWERGHPGRSGETSNGGGPRGSRAAFPGAFPTMSPASASGRER